ncbi:hypothetical protein ACOZ32_14310 (plasmid) [Halobacterium sp. MBLA0001]|uniref:hypothetical protein n=1 Tax=Halobacterium sp. MBLA0001 TaxID=3413511 RepID=UPI003C731369
MVVLEGDCVVVRVVLVAAVVVGVAVVLEAVVVGVESSSSSSSSSSGVAGGCWVDCSVTVTEVVSVFVFPAASTTVSATVWVPVSSNVYVTFWTFVVVVVVFWTRAVVLEYSRSGAVACRSRSDVFPAMVSLSTCHAASTICVSSSVVVSAVRRVEDPLVIVSSTVIFATGGSVSTSTVLDVAIRL